MNTKALLILPASLFVVTGYYFIGPLTIETNNRLNGEHDILLQGQNRIHSVSSTELVTAPMTKQIIEPALSGKETIPLKDQAIQSLKHARINGDKRSPPIHHSELTQRANPQQIDDPDQYSDFQANKKKQLISHYIQAIQPKIARLKEQIQEAKEKGLPAEQLAEGEDKVKKMQDMLNHLEQQYPELLILDDV